MDDQKTPTHKPATTDASPSQGSNFAAAQAFFEACETGKGWDACAQFCGGDAAPFGGKGFVGSLSGVKTIKDYTGFMQVSGAGHVRQRRDCTEAIIALGSAPGSGPLILTPRCPALLPILGSPSCIA